MTRQPDDAAPASAPPTLRTACRQRRARRTLRALDRTLSRPGFYPHPAGRIERRETHISVVYLAGRFAYKIKKPVTFGFADFSESIARKRSCEAELRLNRKLARPLYLGLVRIGANARAARGVGRNALLDEYAVRMRRFDERMLFSQLLARGVLQRADIDRAAAQLATYHLHAPHNVPRRAVGSAVLLRAQLDDVLDGCAMQMGVAHIERLRRWCANEYARVADVLDQRRAMGLVRSCHGDLHLNNILRWRDTALMFDCIDFNDALRWVDVANDLAFLLMDLRAHGRTDLANRLLNHWLEATGDYGALAPLRLYIVYRALVRAFVACLGPPAPASRMASIRYLEAAIAATNETATWQPRALLLCHGYSGSGKSAASRALAEHYPAIRVSSDALRKRVRAFGPLHQTALSADAYTADAMDRVYGDLLDTAREVLRNGYSVIVDATFLKRRHRAAFIRLADALGVRVWLLDFHASDACIASRIDQRAQARDDLSDADLSVLDVQRASAEPLTAGELAVAASFDTDVPLSVIESAQYWQPVLGPDCHRRRAAASHT
jgi:uncharacterized protein